MKKRPIPPPSAAAMKKFSKKFERPAWDKCCANAAFLAAVDTNLTAAERLAVEILSNDFEDSEDE